METLDKWTWLYIAFASGYVIGAMVIPVIRMLLQ